MTNYFSDIRPVQERMEIAKKRTPEEECEILLIRYFMGELRFSKEQPTGPGLSPGPNPPKDRR